MVFAIAAPMTLAYLTTPILGLVDTGVVGQFGDAALIGGLAVGAVVFDIVYSAFNLVAGMSGFVARAFGADDRAEQQAVYWRSVVIALSLGLLLLVLAVPVREAGVWLMNPGAGVAEAARQYIGIRLLAAPATMLNYANIGLLLGQGRALAALGLQTVLNGINIALSIWLGLGLGWAISGVAWGTVIAEYVAALAGFAIIVSGFDRSHAPGLARILDRHAMLTMIAVNRDVMIRTMALLGAFALFTRFGARLGAVTLAGNAILMNFFMIAGYYLDGFAVAAEQICGRAIGARFEPAFWRAVRLSALWGFLLAVATTLAVLAFGGFGIDLLARDEAVRAAAKAHLFWAAITATTGVLAFLMDGVFVGASLSRDMRNTTILAFATFAVTAWALMPALGNLALWIALNAFLLVRGLSLAALLPRRARSVFSPTG